MENDIVAKAAELIRQRTAQEGPEGSDPYCVVSLLDERGFPTASAITAAKADGIARLYFGTGLGCGKVERIRRDPRACVCFAANDYSIALLGKMEIRTDPETKQAMWYAEAANHFSGPDDPDYCVLAFTTERYRLFVDWKEVHGTLIVPD